MVNWGAVVILEDSRPTTSADCCEDHAPSSRSNGCPNVPFPICHSSTPISFPHLVNPPMSFEPIFCSVLNPSKKTSQKCQPMTTVIAWIILQPLKTSSRL